MTHSGLEFEYNVHNLFIGEVQGDIPMTAKDIPLLNNWTFLASSLLPHNLAKGDSTFTHVTGNNPSEQGDISTSLGKTLNAFSHFMFCHSHGSKLLVDFQGITQCLLIRMSEAHELVRFLAEGHRSGVCPC